MNFNRYRNGNSQVAPVNPRMIYNPTVVPAQNNGAAGAVQPADDYIAIRVDTTGLTTATKIVLFDGGEGYQLTQGYVMPSGVVITGLSGAPYQFILNDIVHANSFFNMMQISVVSADSDTDDQKAVKQFARQVSIYETGKGGDTRLIRTINPRKGLHEGQFQKNILTFKEELVVTHRRAFVYVQEPNAVVDWGFYQRAELGRTQ